MTPMTPSAFVDELIATIERSGYSLVPTADLDRLRAVEALWREPHTLGFPVSARTGTYDHDTVMVRRDWYDRLRAALGDRAAEEGR